MLLLLIQIIQHLNRKLRIRTLNKQNIPHNFPQISIISIQSSIQTQNLILDTLLPVIYISRTIHVKSHRTNYIQQKYIRIINLFISLLFCC